MSGTEAVQVNLFGRFAGAVASLRGKPGFYEFSHAPEFRRSGLDIAPLRMRAGAKNRFSFPELSLETWYGLPGLLADALPDRFGRALMDEHFARNGLPPECVTTLHRLLQAGRRAMGAMEFGSPGPETGAAPVAGCHPAGRRSPVCAPG